MLEVSLPLAVLKTVPGRATPLFLITKILKLFPAVLTNGVVKSIEFHPTPDTVKVPLNT